MKQRRRQGDTADASASQTAEINGNAAIMTLGTPALLFGSISLLMLAYTNRFLVLARLIRDMHDDARAEDRRLNLRQIPSLRLRLQLIKAMQALGVLSFLICTVSMFCLFLAQVPAGEILFGISVVVLMLSLICSLWEVLISTTALDVVLSDYLDTTDDG